MIYDCFSFEYILEEDLHLLLFSWDMVLHTYILSKQRPIISKHVGSYAHKKTSTLPKKSVLSCHFFQIFREKLHAIMHIIVQKNASFVKSKLYYAPKKSVGFPYIPSYHEKITALILVFCQKTIRSVKRTSKKTLIISKTSASMSYFFKFS